MSSEYRHLQGQQSTTFCLKSVEYLSDQALITLAQAGEQTAFEQVVERYHSPLLHFITKRLKSEDEAYDVLQHVFIQLYLALPTLSTTHPIKPWLFRVASNRSIDELRRKQRHPTLLFSHFEDGNNEEEVTLVEQILDPSPSPEEQVEQEERHDRLRRAIVQLPSRFRAIVMLRCRDNLRFSEVARKLEMPESTVKTYYQRARRLLSTMIAA